ncbi:MAG: hypothetical protein JXX29_10950 [Deltaproteobacteria bacterium]|nr:hypothetical protein [Deltaproteobacteria bacterium]MBN2672187.1 hypothetical protein [Deltaproteobacteria bacterium]
MFETNDSISKETLVSLLDRSPMAAALFCENRLMWASARARDLFGNFEEGAITSEELVVKVIPNTHMRESFLERIRKDRFADSSVREKPLQLECRSIRGELLQCEMFISRRDEWSLLYINVVSTFRYNAEILCETEKMASLGRLSEGLAHEINNPLAAIGQNLQLIWHRLLMTTAKNNDVAGQCGTSLSAIEKYLTKRGITEMFETVLEQNIRASRIVHEMLTFAPNERSHQYHPQQVGELLEQAFLLARRDYFQHTPLGFDRIQVRIAVSEDVPHIVCQAWKMQQAFFAIIKNAAEAVQKRFGMSTGGKLTITAKKEDRFVRIYFSDNGIGMTDDIRSKVFEPYFTTKSGNLGTGLGLASCYYIIHQEHFGELSVESTAGQGSTFIVSIPYQNESLNSLVVSVYPPSAMQSEDK